MALPLISLSANQWVCVNPSSAYASGVEITINIERTAANLRYEFRDSGIVAPTQTTDITEAVQSLSVKAVDGKGFLWLISQNVDVDVQIETITPSIAVVALPAGKTPVVGSFSAVGVSSIFEPVAGRDFNLQVVFGIGATGSVQLEQSLDGVNFYPLTGSGVAIMRFTSTAVEQWSNNEVGAKFRLKCTAISGGAINYRISQ